jgi:hypothetical protein
MLVGGSPIDEQSPAETRDGAAPMTPTGIKLTKENATCVMKLSSTLKTALQ